MDLNLLLKICAIIVLAGIAFKLLKVFTSIIFKVALFVVVCLLVLKFFKFFYYFLTINIISLCFIHNIFPFIWIIGKISF